MSDVKADTDPQGNHVAEPVEAVAEGSVPASYRPLRLATAAVMGATLVWLVLLVWDYPFLATPPRPTGLMPPPPTAAEEALARLRSYQNACLLFGLCGIAVVASMTFAELVGRRSVGKLVLLASAAALGGGLGGVLAGCAANAADESHLLYKLDSPRFAGRTLALQVVGWGVAGIPLGAVWAAAGSLGARRVASAAAGAAVGGVCGALLYQLVSGAVGIIAPVGESVSLVPENGLNRWLWFSSAALGFAVGAGCSARSRRSAKG